MILRRVLLGLLAAAMFAAAASVTIFALAFALYAWAEPRLGRAGAAGAVALAAATFMAIGGLAISIAARRPARKPPSAAGGALERAISFVRRKPIVAASAAIGAGLLAARNPKYLGEVLRAFLEGDDTKR